MLEKKEIPLCEYFSEKQPTNIQVRDISSKKKIGEYLIFFCTISVRQACHYYSHQKCFQNKYRIYLSFLVRHVTVTYHRRSLATSENLIFVSPLLVCRWVLDLLTMDALLHRQPPTVWEQFTSSPLLFLSRLLYTPPLPVATQFKHQPERDKIHIVCISDTHNTHNSQPPIPNGDILIHAGDLTVSGTKNELDNVLSWLESQPHPHKFFIGGNHDTHLAATPESEIHEYISSTYPSLIYLQESSAQVTIRGRTLRVYGSPYTPQHGSWVFQYPKVHAPWYSPSEKPTSEYQSTKIWSRIPPLTDILITHGPPLAHLDSGSNINFGKSTTDGCYALLTALWHVRPKVHVFGHIHVGRGVELVRWDAMQKVYEEVCARRVGWSGLVGLVWWKMVLWFWGSGLTVEDGVTVMVNAASVGGVRDDRRLGSITIDI